MSVKNERVYVLKGFIHGVGEQVQYFTGGEKPLALHVAKLWYAKGWQPFLFSKTYGGNFKTWYDYRVIKTTKERKAA